MLRRYYTTESFFALILYCHQNKFQFTLIYHLPFTLKVSQILVCSIAVSIETNLTVFTRFYRASHNINSLLKYTATLHPKTSNNVDPCYCQRCFLQIFETFARVWQIFCLLLPGTGYYNKTTVLY